MYIYVFWGEIKANVFAGTCFGGWVSVLPADTCRNTILWLKGDP
jgi:hypothetical protein